MNVENKLRKFKLIDKQGWLKSNSCNSNIIVQYFKEDGTVEGIIDCYPKLRDSAGSKVLISSREFQFFEEILSEQETPTPEESLYWREGTPPKAGLIVGRNCSGDNEYFVKYVGDSFAVLADKREETTSAISNLRSLVKSDKEVIFEKVLSEWKGLSLDNTFDSKNSTVNLMSFFDVMYTVMKEGQL